MTNVNTGIVFEYLVRNFFHARGFKVMRAAGSKGPFDLIVWKGEDVRVIQCKKEKRKKNYEAEVIIMKLLQVPKGWKKRLWVKRGKEVWVHDLTDEKFGVKVRTVKDINKLIKERHEL